MLTNEQMIAGRYLRWHRARRRVEGIQSHLRAGGTVLVSTYTHSTQYNKPGHADLFKATRSGVYALHGKKWLCIDGCSITFWRAA